MSNGKHSKEIAQKKELGLHTIERSFNREIDVSVTKVHNGSVRSGKRIEFEGSIVILRRCECRGRSYCRRTYNCTSEQ